MDDGTVSYTYGRLEISLRPISDEELNRQFASHSKGGAKSTNPYTYGDWRPMGDRWTPPRFTVFLLKVKNYAYPKILVDPYRAELVSESGRRYKALSLEELSGYYQAFALGHAGNAYARFEERRDILKATLYPSKRTLFSGQEQEGYVVFPSLDDDVREFSVTLKDVALRFDYRNIPIETIDLIYRFHRKVYKGYYPPPSLMEKR